MNKKKLTDKELLVKLKKTKVHYRKIKELTSQVRIGGQEISKRLRECNLNQDLNYCQLLPLDDLNIQRLDEIIKLLKEDPIEDEFDFLQYYLLSRELTITMKELHQKFDFARRLGIFDKKEIEDLMNKIDLIEFRIDKMTDSGKKSEKVNVFQQPEALINTIRQSILNRKKELLN
jgi:hypothetical protein